MNAQGKTQRLLLILVVLFVVQGGLVAACGFTAVTRLIAIAFFLLYFALIVRQRRGS